MTKFLFIFSSLFSAGAFANPACLSQVSNYDLVNEVSRRLGNGGGGGGGNPGGGGGGGNGALFTVSCSSSGTLNLRTINPMTGMQKAMSEFIGIECNEYVSSLLQVSNVGLSRNILVSYCSSSGTLYKTLVNIDGSMTQISNDFVGIPCKRNAIDSNLRLQP